MESELPNLIRLSQAHLNLLETCPPKFQQVYLDKLGSLPRPEQQESIAWGSRFHFLMQQRELGLPIEPLLETDRELEDAFKALVQAAPDIFADNLATWREAEHWRTLSIAHHLLTVIYDLIIAEPKKVTILDWKTYRQPQKKQHLANNWQTRLYLYVLAETSEYLPEQITMTYWFVKSANPQSLTFTYDRQRHQQTKQDLSHLLANLTQWLQAYNSATPTSFPHLPDCAATCPYYQYLGEEVASGDRHKSNILTSIADIEEVSI